MGRPFRFLGVVVVLAIAACDPFPRDISGTTDHVMAGKTLRAGIVAGGGEAGEQDFAARLAKAAGASPDIEKGSAETLIPRLEKGELDLVLGAFAKASPWKKRAAFTGPVKGGKPDERVPVLRAAIRKGENRWLLFVSRQIAENRR